mgnify:CR=1 FL=1
MRCDANEQAHAPHPTFRMYESLAMMSVSLSSSFFQLCSLYNTHKPVHLLSFRACVPFERCVACGVSVVPVAGARIVDVSVPEPPCDYRYMRILSHIRSTYHDVWGFSSPFPSFSVSFESWVAIGLANVPLGEREMLAPCPVHSGHLMSRDKLFRTGRCGSPKLTGPEFRRHSRTAERSVATLLAR